VKLSAEAMNAALNDFTSLEFSTKKVSLYESLLVGAWLLANNRYPDPKIDDADHAVTALFEILPGEDMGRLRPCRYAWQVAERSGRKTVWNNTTRGKKLATSVFLGDDLREGLLPNAAAVAASNLAGERLPSLDALAVLVTRDHDYPAGADWSDAHAELARRLSLTSSDLAQITDARPLGVPLLGAPEWSAATIPKSLGPEETVTLTAPPPPGAPTATADQVVLDPRIERMLLRAIERAQCVLLVGPPGSGKGVLIRWLVERVRSNPGALGFQAGLDPNLMWRTPDESWSAFELIGGFVPGTGGQLVWSDGLLLTAVAEERWLVLDETNRADLDKIMGPLLTWLSGQGVEIGRTTAVGGTPIHIDWADTPQSQANDPHGQHRPTEFLAGKDWRLLGTYNPLDAQRVFRMGQALSRRFVIVPIPALSPPHFEHLLATRYPSLSDEAALAIGFLYSAHHGESETLLGPAVFLRMADFLVGSSTTTEEEIAEAYVANVGKFVAAFDDATFDALGERIIDEGALTSEQWAWITTQRSILG
jgi:hypothetical protein